MNADLKARADVGVLMLVLMLAAAAMAGCGGEHADEPESIGTSREALACFHPSSTARINVGSQGTQANSHSFTGPSSSGNGRFVAFSSDASNLVTGDFNLSRDIFVRDLVAGQTSRVSVSSSGAETDGHSDTPSISSDGRFVAFSSLASNLVAGDANFSQDIFVRDRSTSQTTLVSVSSSGAQANDSSGLPAISADGRFVAFSSGATNLVAGDANNASDIFVRDLTTNQTTLVSVSSSGAQANNSSFRSAISADGRFVAFLSFASNLVAGDTNNQGDIFVRDRATNQTTRVSVSSGGMQGNGITDSPDISADGRFVAFHTNSTNLVAGDFNFFFDVFVHDRTASQTTRVSVASGGAEGNSHSRSPGISADGRLVAFVSEATNFAPGDTNQASDVFVHDRTTNTTTRVSVAGDGSQADNHSFAFTVPRVSSDNRSVLFNSTASNLVPDDTNESVDIFVRELPQAPAWAPGTSYVAAARVTHEGVIYECIQSHTSLAGWEPPATPSLWQRPTPCGGLPWTPQTAYVVGTRVTFEGSTYECIQSHTSQTGWEPTRTPALWRL